MRNPNAFTKRQIRLIKAVRDKVREINDPDPEIITDETYEWRYEQTRQFGRIPKIRFKPYSSQVKAELVRQAGFIDDDRERQLERLRLKYGVGSARNKEARLFESEWNNIMFKIKKAAFAVGFINQIFSGSDQKVAEPIRITQEIVLEEFSLQLKARQKPIHVADSDRPAETRKNKGIRPYDQQLAALE
jgi:hypothetical protein